MWKVNEVLEYTMHISYDPRVPPRGLYGFLIAMYMIETIIYRMSSVLPDSGHLSTVSNGQDASHTQGSSGRVAVGSATNVVMPARWQNCCCSQLFTGHTLLHGQIAVHPHMAGQLTCLKLYAFPDMCNDHRMAQVNNFGK